MIFAHLLSDTGILFGFEVFFLGLYLVATQYNSFKTSSAEKLVFRRGHVPKQFSNHTNSKDEEIGSEKASTSDSSSRDRPEKGEDVNAIAPQEGIFTWRNVSYDMSFKGETRRILDNVSGGVKPGTLTALMGVSGAGKTTLLDVLAQRKILSYLMFTCQIYRPMLKANIFRQSDRCSHRRYACQWQNTRFRISKNDRIRSAARPPSRDDNSS